MLYSHAVFHARSFGTDLPVLPLQLASPCCELVQEYLCGVGRSQALYLSITDRSDIGSRDEQAGRAVRPSREGGAQLQPAMGNGSLGFAS